LISATFLLDLVFTFTIFSENSRSVSPMHQPSIDFMVVASIFAFSSSQLTA
jgi:hypothetical protein